MLYQFYVFQVIQQINLLLYDHFIPNTTHSIIAAIGMKRFSDLDIMTYICARYRISGNTTDKFIAIYDHFNPNTTHTQSLPLEREDTSRLQWFAW